MKTPNTIERDLDRIRLKIYEKTKDMTSEQLTAYYKNSVDEVEKKYGFKFIRHPGFIKKTKTILRG